MVNNSSSTARTSLVVGIRRRPLDVTAVAVVRLPKLEELRVAAIPVGFCGGTLLFLQIVNQLANGLGPVMAAITVILMLVMCVWTGVRTHCTMRIKERWDDIDKDEEQVPDDKSSSSRSGGFLPNLPSAPSMPSWSGSLPSLPDGIPHVEITCTSSDRSGSSSDHAVHPAPPTGPPPQAHKSSSSDSGPGLFDRAKEALNNFT